MNCKHCDTGNTPEGGIHIINKELLRCEIPPPPVVGKPLSDQEKRELFRVIEIASEIRMMHDYSLWTALDVVKLQSRIVFENPGVPTSAIVKLLLENVGHKCTSRCTEPKVST